MSIHCRRYLSNLKRFLKPSVRHLMVGAGFFLTFSLSSCFQSENTGKSEGQTEGLTQQEMLVMGQRQYHLRGCIKCHGRTGEGDGYRTQGLPPESAPRNFKDRGAYLQGSGLEEIAFTIRNGITNRPPVARRGLLSLFSGAISKDKTISSSAMPAYPHLTEEEISTIAQYIVYLQTNEIKQKGN